MLLIIFMVVTPMLVDGVEVALPETRAPERMPKSGNQLDVAIRYDGEVYLGSQSVPRKSLPAALRDVHERSPDQNVSSSGRISGLGTSDVREVMRLVNRAGWSGAGIETRKREPVSGDWIEVARSTGEGERA